MRQYKIHIGTYVCAPQLYNILLLERLTVTICIMWTDLISLSTLRFISESSLKHSVRRNNVGRNETMVDIIRFSISRSSIFMYTSPISLADFTENSRNVAAKWINGFAALLAVHYLTWKWWGMREREVIKLHLQIMSRSHLKHSAYSATARVFPRWSTSNYTSILHYAVILVIVSPLCSRIAQFFFLSWSSLVSSHVLSFRHSEQGIAASKKWSYRKKKEKKTYSLRNVTMYVACIVMKVIFEKKYSRGNNVFA